MSCAVAAWGLGQEPQLGGAYAPLASEIMLNLLYLVDLNRLFIF
jgi:hypothetical protein